MASERDIRNQIRYGRIQGHREGHKEGLEEGIVKGIQQGLEQGLQQGIEQGKTETAIKMKAAGIDSETIAECTGLDIETVKSL
ncbi:MAG: hypothetical protein MJY97_06555 [Bacteroidales bacterium]|nr:hypothetical protein [Bacteroidales bacterium]